MTQTRPELPNWIAQHLKQYLETDGREGHEWNGVRTLLLTTTGRNTGKPLQLPLIYEMDGDNYVVVASKGGADDHPAWYKNLVQEPEVDLQVGPKKFRALARTASAKEKPALWEKMAKVWPAYNEYQEKTSREIPVVVLEPKG